MAERSMPHSRTHVEFNWSASRASNFRRATVEDVSDESEEATRNIPGAYEGPDRVTMTRIRAFERCATSKGA